MKNRLKFAAAVFSAAFTLSSITAIAQGTEPAHSTNNEIVLEDNRNLTPKGNAELTDNVSDNENLQFITVTSKDGNVFYFVIDKSAESENVYFLNTVDDGDLAALIEQKDGAVQEPISTSPAETEPIQPPTEQEAPNETEQEQAPKKTNNTMVYVILFVLAVGGIAAYYFKVLLPKKKLEQADDIEDFEFEEDEEVVNEDETIDMSNQ